MVIACSTLKISVIFYHRRAVHRHASHLRIFFESQMLYHSADIKHLRCISRRIPILQPAVFALCAGEYLPFHSYDKPGSRRVVRYYCDTFLLKVANLKMAV